MENINEALTNYFLKDNPYEKSTKEKSYKKTIILEFNWAYYFMNPIKRKLWL